MFDLSLYKTCGLVRTKDGLMLVNTKDEYIGPCIGRHGEWEPHVRQALHAHIKPGMTVMDIGANIGAHTIFMSRLVGREGTCLAFEPCKINHDLLVTNLMLNGCFNTKVYDEGVGDTTETRYIASKWSQYESVENYGCIHLRSESSSPNDEVIKVVTIDSLNLQKLDVVKIDAEEMEEQVIKGMHETIKRCKPTIVVEIHPNEVPIMSDLFKTLNYKLTHIDNIDYVALPLL
jgi:FkbM family methyltransferase